MRYFVNSWSFSELIGKLFSVSSVSDVHFSTRIETPGVHSTSNEVNTVPVES